MGREQSVILVDDDPAMLDLYGRGLELAGYRVTQLGDAESLFQALARELPAVVVLDWDLRGLTGSDILRMLREDERTAHLAVFMLSNHSSLGDNAEVDAIRAGAIAWLVKARTTPGQLADEIGDVFAREQKAG